MITPQDETTTDVSSDQTGFASEEALFLDQSLPVDPDAPVLSVKPWWKRPAVILGVIGLVIIVIVLMLAILLQPRQQKQVFEPSPTPKAAANLDPLQQYILTLQYKLQAADPANQELPFPPVLMDLPLDPPGQATR